MEGHSQDLQSEARRWPLMLSFHLSLSLSQTTKEISPFKTQTIPMKSRSQPCFLQAAAPLMEVQRVGCRSETWGSWRKLHGDKAPTAGSWPAVSRALRARIQSQRIRVLTTARAEQKQIQRQTAEAHGLSRSQRRDLYLRACERVQDTPAFREDGLTHTSGWQSPRF